MNKKLKSKKPNSITKKIALVVGIVALASGIIFIIYFFIAQFTHGSPTQLIIMQP